MYLEGLEHSLLLLSVSELLEDDCFAPKSIFVLWGKVGRRGVSPRVPLIDFVIRHEGGQAQTYRSLLPDSCAPQNGIGEHGEFI